METFRPTTALATDAASTTKKTGTGQRRRTASGSEASGASSSSASVRSPAAWRKCVETVSPTSTASHATETAASIAIHCRGPRRVFSGALEATP